MFNQRVELMRNWPFLLILFILIICTVQPVQAVDPYATAKSAYIASHPGQSIIPYPWEPTSAIKVLPLNFPVPAVPGNNISIAACKDQFESSSFIITAQKNIDGIQITSSSLKDGAGHTIPVSAIDIRTVKVWYQANATDVANIKISPVLAPELLLKNDSLIKVDYTKQRNLIWIKNKTFEGYFPIDNTTINRFPSDVSIYDQATSSGDIQPFSLLQNENKQIWLTTHIPTDAVTGNYTGTITISSPTSGSVAMNITVWVLPFTLEPASLDYGLYYVAMLPARDTSVLTSTWKTPATMLIELQDMKDHGIMYPTFAQNNDTKLDAVFALRNTVGFPKDKIFLVPGGGWYTSFSSYIGNPTSAAGLAALKGNVTMWRNHTRTYGYTDTYFYGMDEAVSPTLETQRTAWGAVHAAGGKVFTPSWYWRDLANNVADILDAANIGYPPDSSEAAIWHTYGHKAYVYNNPQAGVENPELYRKNYGYKLWISGYDGTMEVAYQETCGAIWNDFDCPKFRDHVFAYPTTNGVIDTIEWEGWREGVDDIRYADTLTRINGSDIITRAIISDAIVKEEDMATIRKKIIAQILISSLKSVNN
jgi:hypothetical protein